MAIAGIPFDIPPARIVQSIKSQKGVVTGICKELDICWHTYAKHIRDVPEYKELIELARHDYDDTLCDLAENALARALRQEEDMSASLKAAQFVLNNRGRKRGYKPPAMQVDEKEFNHEKAIESINAVSGD